ncbi:MAG: cytochrome B [Armatimonadetes bacterium CG_4_10_14_3_um_filter_66_18]|nr:DedA family protein [Armatimonadota bacterium]OIP11765.1 MAG: cytochrome B [Armatimonadetes bacterium CG2_30_66_41]PIU93990.1 MAG: cytochrome B [Armatimonadetes bacterium CG06_land_8_20_14_3_00_66_21]PIX49017.1 MAG: cytochrome B [Armatimonadetes bacterium CG_4_8_14_3_um_filter_66_20]PIY36936.1 MAG: cytochrome B [Armatimonadetes bacterium CG_4_10_14_3_um_filter_66_18]PIZ32157.1 MAG: cytochrome B [Armatimonadetes bacterium CG_4_10_14_0_8_um_filter_66_14]PJB60957.1 MAG: cytochrome B [Armatimo
MVRKLYDWVLHWAETPYGLPALFILSFAESSFFPIPPDVLLIALAVSIPTRAFRYALVCTAGSSIGGMGGYAIGLFGYDAIGKPIIDFYNGQAVMDKIKHLYDTNGFWGVLLAALTPIPYKVFTIASGFFQFNFGAFMLASLCGRALRFFAVGVMIYFFGPKIKEFIDKYFNVLAMVFAVLLVGGFVLIKVVLKH